MENCFFHFWKTFWQADNLLLNFWGISNLCKCTVMLLLEILSSRKSHVIPFLQNVTYSSSKINQGNSAPRRGKYKHLTKPWSWWLLKNMFTLLFLICPFAFYFPIYAFVCLCQISQLQVLWGKLLQILGPQEKHYLVLYKLKFKVWSIGLCSFS